MQGWRGENAESIAMREEKGKDEKKVYQELKGELIPIQDKDKLEICFVIDTEQVPSSSCGFYIFERLIPLLDKKVHTAFCMETIYLLQMMEV